MGWELERGLETGCEVAGCVTRVDEGSVQDGKQQYALTRAPNNRAKEVQVKEVGPVTPAPEKPAVVPPAKLVPVKTGYADALCRGITKPPAKGDAVYMQVRHTCGWFVWCAIGVFWF